MTDEDRQRQMDFILDQQAQLTATMGQLSAKVDKLAEKVDTTAGSVAALLVIAEIHEREINANSAAVHAVDARQRETDERLNALINTVERYIAERRNGKG